MARTDYGTTVRVSHKTHKKLIKIREHYTSKFPFAVRISMGALIDVMASEALEDLED